MNNTEMPWKDYVLTVIKQYCQASGSDTFTLSQFYDAHHTQFENFSSKNNHPKRKVEQQLQVLRDEGRIDFIDNNGTYKLKD